MIVDLPEEQKPDTKPPRKTGWFWNVLFFICTLGYFGGLNVILLQDIPLLLFLIVAIGLLVWPIVLMGKKPKHRAVLGFILWVFVVYAGMLALLTTVIPPFAISPQTTYLTEPRSKKFYGIDYAAFIEKQLDPGVPPEDNGFRLLTETLGRSFFGNNFADKHWNRLCHYLDLSVEIEPTLTFVSWSEYEKTLTPEEKEIVDASFSEFLLPWSEEAMPIVRRWLDENDPALDLFVVAADKPTLYVPPMFDGFFDTLLINDDICRTISRSIQVRVRYRLAIGEIDKAWDDVLVIYRLAEQHRRAIWNVVSALVNTAIVGIANQTAESVLLHSGWTSVEIRRKAEEIAPFLQPFREDEIRMILRNERLMALDYMQHLSTVAMEVSDKKKGGAPVFWDWFKQKNLEASLRRGYAMVELNRQFDEMEQRFFSGALKPGNEMNEPFGMYELLKIFAKHGKIVAVPIMIGRISGGLLLPSAEFIRVTLKRHQTNAALLRIQFALEAYRQENGNYPDKLDDLREEIPLDPFSGEPFRYIAREPGIARGPDIAREPGTVSPGYLLCSVGPNSIDDAGRDHNDFPKGDDIRRQMPNDPL